MSNTAIAVGLGVSKIMTTKYCEECGASEDVLLQELFGHYYCTKCLTVALGGKPAITKARQMRLDESISTSNAAISPDLIDVYWPGQQRASRARQAIDFEEERKAARGRLLRELAQFRNAHPWVQPGMVVVNIDTGDLAVIRDSTNPDIQWTTVYLTTEYSLGMSKKPVVPTSSTLRIGDASEYEEARQLLSRWPTKARSGIHIGESDIDLFNEQFMAALLQQQEVVE